MKFQWTFVVLPYGDLWRRKRKLMHAHVHQGVAERYHSIQISHARRFARDILVAKTEDHLLPQAVRLNFAQMIIKATYGIDVESYESEYISLPERVVENISEATTPGRFFVDFLPIREQHADHDEMT
jgi:cytochrome P450